MDTQFSEFQRGGIQKLDTDTLSTVSALRTSQHLEFLHYQQHAWEICAAPGYKQSREQQPHTATGPMVLHPGNIAYRASDLPRLGTVWPGGRNRLRQLCALICGQALGLTEKLVGCSTWRSLRGSNKATAGLDIPLYCKIIWRWTLMYRKILYSQYYWPAANLKACGIPLSGSIPKQWG